DKAELAVKPMQIQNALPLQSAAGVFSKKSPLSENVPEIVISKQSVKMFFMQPEMVESSI
ncbi:MAG: hypothetical protein V1859_03580, partial [archaeon]